MARKIIRISTFVDESVMSSELAAANLELQEIDNQIVTLESQIADLQRLRRAVNGSISDAMALQQIITRMKNRENEGAN